MSKIPTNPFGFSDGPSVLPSFGGLTTISLENPATEYGLRMTKAMAGSWLSGFWKRLNYYFDVTNSYVLKKLKLILFPYLSNGDWTQELDDDGLPATPRKNQHAPDLYIPLMAYITFILIVGVNSGMKGQFSPEVLGLAASSGIIFVFLEILLIYCGFYFLQSALPAPIDLIAYCGYKFVPCTVNLMATMIFGGESYYPAFCYTGVCLGVFMTKTLKRYTVQNTFSEYMDASSVTNQSFLYFIALLQFPIVFFLGFY
ncbi:YIF1B [Blepharisma stoltei]|uniref:Protein YIF1 n=1 Tax=Blepharisma stoltei TaxID=1481888 RepID=A0AAU9IR83_9CILI|nr:unnamed protein product [Blepharisma stoltei]